jgi:hypothetical protein
MAPRKRGTLQHGTPKKGYFATWHPEKRVLCNMATPKKISKYPFYGPYMKLHSTLFTSILGFENKTREIFFETKKGTLQYV